jgi:hypothetical protein
MIELLTSAVPMAVRTPIMRFYVHKTNAAGLPTKPLSWLLCIKNFLPVIDVLQHIFVYLHVDDDHRHQEIDEKHRIVD